MQEKKRRFNHLSFEKRQELERMLKAKLPVKQIALALGVHNTTIYREMKRGECVQRDRSHLRAGVFAVRTRAIHGHGRRDQGRIRYRGRRSPVLLALRRRRRALLHRGERGGKQGYVRQGVLSG